MFWPKDIVPKSNHHDFTLDDLSFGNFYWQIERQTGVDWQRKRILGFVSDGGVSAASSRTDVTDECDGGRCWRMPRGT